MQDIKAGGAFVEVRTKDDSFYEGLENEESYLRSWATRIGAIGAVATAAIGSATALRAGLVKQYADAGTRIVKLAQESGFTAEKVSILDYVASQTSQTFQQLAKTVKEGLDPASQRQFDALSKEAQRLGLVMSTADAQGAAKLTRSISELGQVVAMVSNKIGAAFAPEVLQATRWMVNALAPIARWVEANKRLLASLGMISGVSLTIAGSITAISVAIALLGPLAPTIAAVTIGLLSIGAAAVAVYKNWSTLVSFASRSLEALANFAGRAGFTMASNWQKYFSSMLQGVRVFTNFSIEYFRAIANAIAAGELAAAWELLLAGMNLGWAKFAAGINTTWLATVEGFTVAWAQGAFEVQKVLINAFSVIEKAWAKSANWMAKTWNDAMSGAAILVSRAQTNFLRATATGAEDARLARNQEELESAIVANATEADNARGSGGGAALLAQIERDRVAAIAAAQKTRDAAINKAQNAGPGEDPVNAEAEARARFAAALKKAQSFKPFSFDAVEKLSSISAPNLTSSKSASAAGGTFSGFNAAATLGANNYDADTARNTGQTVQLLQQLLAKQGFR